MMDTATQDPGAVVAVKEPAYAAITPARNEEIHIRDLVQSMVQQTCRPVRWVLVDDGSTDATGRLIDEAASQHPWISALHRADRGYRKQGGGVVDTFYDGLEQLRDVSWDFLVKLDADLSFQTDYFSRCLARFQADARLGIAGGLIGRTLGNDFVCESPGDPAFHVRGATKIYRRACWEQIGGLVRAPGWDTIDELKANMLGWTTGSFPDIHLHHHRMTGTADGTWKNYTKFGLANYITGYHPVFMFLKCAHRAFRRPFVIGAAGLAWGFLKGYLAKTHRVEDPAFRHYVRRQQMNWLFKRPNLWQTTIGERMRQ